jgi:hypothetical protein
MANISLDIKANTQKALGEFKKLSRELDNKFLVQGLKLDVVKTAFRDITRQFDSAVSDQGFKAGETAAQLRNNLSANLVALRRFGGEASNQLSGQLQEITATLRAQGTIGAEAYTVALKGISFAEFGGTEEERKQQFKKLTKEIAIFGQETADVYGQNVVPDLTKILKGEMSAEDAFGIGSATTNLINDLIRSQGVGLSQLSSISNIERTKLLESIVSAFQEEESFIKGKADLEKSAPFLRIRREIEGLFEPTKGIFGALREITIGDETTSLVQEAAKLINTIFGRETGIFAILNKSLSDTFGGFDVLGIIIQGTKLLTSGLEKLGEFFGSETFKSFLEVFTPIQEAFEGVLANGFSFNPSSINKFIDQIFDSIQGLITNIGEFIKGIDGSKIGGIVSNLFDNLVETVKVLFGTISKLIKGIDAGQLGGVIAAALDSLTEILPSLISLLGTALGKAVEVAGSTIAQSSGGTKLALGALGTGLIADNVTKFLTGGEGILGLIKKAIINKIPFIGKLVEKTENARAAKGSDQERWNLLYQKLDTISEKLGGGNGLLDLLRRKSPRSPNPYRSGSRFTPRLTGSSSARLPGTSTLPRLPGAGGAPRLPGSNVIPRRLPGVSPRNLTNVTPGAPRGGGGFGGPKGIGGQIVDVTAYAVDDVVGALPGASRGATTAARIAPKILGAANVIGKIATPLTLLIGGIRAFQTITDKEKTQREKTRGVTQIGAGVAGGLAGGALGLKAGAAIGTVLGGPAGTAIGGGIGTLLGGFLGAVAGEEAVKALSDPIIDGITEFGGAVGTFFVGLWGGTTNFFGAWGKSIMDFFGKEGPIQKTGAFAKKLYEDLGGGISTVWEGITDSFASITNWFKEKLDPITARLPGGNTESKDGKALGGAGRGLTLVGENGPELVNLGSGSVVTPQSSFAGLFGGGGGGRGGVINNNIVVNINAPGAELFANEIADNVLEKMDEIYENQKALGVKTT